MYEGVGKVLLSELKNGLMSSFRGKLGGLLIKPVLKKSMKKYVASEYGGAPLLGLKGLVVKTHGSATHKEVTTSIIQCVSFKEEKINEKIRDRITVKE